MADSLFQSIARCQAVCSSVIQDWASLRRKIRVQNCVQRQVYTLFRNEIESFNPLQSKIALILHCAGSDQRVWINSRTMLLDFLERAAMNRKITEFGGVTLDGLHQRSGVSGCSRHSFTVVIRKTFASLPRAHGCEVRNPGAVQSCDIRNAGYTDPLEQWR